MALLFMESFDGAGGTAAHMTAWSGVPTLLTSGPTPRTGTYCARGNNIVRTVTPASATTIVGFAFYWDGASPGGFHWYLGPGETNMQVQLWLGTDGKAHILAADNSVIASTGSPVLVASSWNFIELKVLVSNSGTYAVKVNGATVLSGSADTMYQSTNTVGAVSWYVPSNGGLDDVYVLDSSGSYLNDFIGDCKVECLGAQTGNGANTGLTCSTGSDHGALVDDSPANDDTDYNSSATAGVKDTYTFPSVATVGTIHAVQATMRAKKTDSATKELAIVARQGGTDYDGATQTVSTNYSPYQQIWERRPSDSAAWSISDVNAAEFGVKVVS